ncbi:MAG TPA: MaoC family dehydratase N-terminal domain-containing protein [Candidatus Stackebrandtia faecavium]|nr:MaoC family dehydratase N-terminal domain-containing protein [Candidatus Stackebrandtia faecavium]
MLNLGYLGTSLPPSEPVEVTADAVRKFAASLNLPDAGQTDMAPPTFVFTVTLPAADPLFDDPEFGLDFSRVLHREQRFSYARPVRVGDWLTCVVVVDSIKSVAGNELLALRTDVTDGDDEVVASVFTTLFVAGDAVEEGDDG